MEYTKLITDQQSVRLELCWTSARFSTDYYEYASLFGDGFGRFSVAEYITLGPDDRGITSNADFPAYQRRRS